MMADCPRPDADLSTNRAITDSLIAAHQRIVECNIVRDQAREYVRNARERLTEEQPDANQ